MNLLSKSIRQLSQMLKAKEITSVDLVTESLEQINKYDGTVNSFITVGDEKKLLAQAAKSDAERTNESSALHGIPYAVKDAYVTEDLKTTAASDVLREYQPPYTATVINKLHEAGAILMGKNNLDAWGHGGSNENSTFGPVKNPWDTERIAGGSSGGSAASVASRMVAFTIGEDTGGSIRNPASMCGVTGLKVTYGRVSRYGSIAYASSLDTVGPIAKSAEDIALVLESIAGKDILDASSSHRPVDTYSEKNAEIKNTKIAVPKEFFAEGISSEVKKVLQEFITTLKENGAVVEEISIPALEHSIPIYYLLATSETSSNLARYDGVRYGNDRSHFTPENARRIMLGTYALSAGYTDELYLKAQKARTLLINEFNAAFKKYDVLLGPVTPIVPAKLGELINNPIQNMLSDLYTVTSNIVGVPSLAIPAGFSETGLPIGAQLIGQKFAEQKVLSIAQDIQSKTNYHLAEPTILKK